MSDRRQKWVAVPAETVVGAVWHDVEIRVGDHAFPVDATVRDAVYDARKGIFPETVWLLLEDESFDLVPANVPLPSVRIHRDEEEPQTEPETPPVAGPVDED